MSYYNNIEHINDIFKKKPKMIMKKIENKNYIGVVNGLYATSTCWWYNNY